MSIHFNEADARFDWIKICYLAGTLNDYPKI